MATALNEITLLVFDEKENFNSETTQHRIGKVLFRKVLLIENRADFDNAYNKLGLDDKFILICHVFHAAQEGIALRGYIHFNGTGIQDKYHVKPIFVSAGDSGEVMKNMFTQEQVSSPVYIYSKIRENIKLGELTIYTKRMLESAQPEEPGKAGIRNKKATFKFAIIAALYKDEFEQMKNLFEWLPEEDVVTATKKYFVGHVKGKPEERFVVGIPAATGMVDSAIIATQMLEMFSPEYLLMSGVCGVKSSLEIGDVVVASSVFTFQKGKVSDIRDKEGELIKLFDANKNDVDFDHLYNNMGDQIAISVEKFEPEKGSPLDIHPLVKDAIEPQLVPIQESINKIISPYRKKGITVHFEPMACSTMVINKEGYFEANIKPLERKVAAVEMESYGVARATTIANNGKTKWIIFKSAMDNMSMKDDDSKKFAARCSALFLSHLLESGVLPLPVL